MFKRLFLKNFKIWKDQLWDEGVELAPVTLFLGPNSAGKTSILQQLLLLKQTFESTDRHLDLNLGGQATDLIDLGAYKDIIHNHDETAGLGLGLDFEGELREQEPIRFSYQVTYTLAGGTPTVQELSFQEPDTAPYALSRQLRGAYLLNAPGYTPPPNGSSAEKKRVFRPERSLTFSAEALAELGKIGGRVQDLGLALNRAINEIAWLGPLRERPERSYVWNSQNPGDLGSRGERAIHALLSSANSRKKHRDDEEGEQGWLVEQVSAWLKTLGIAERLELKRQGRSRFFEVIIHGDGRHANLTDVGFGISQVLPMLVLAYFVPRGATILAEQPEIHLHPRAQGGLAELMVEVARERGVQFIVETHSEHMFRRLQNLIAEEALQPEACRLYFIDRDQDHNATLQRLKTDRYGRIDNWPPRFFGDAMGETERQVRTIIERKRREALL